MTRPIKTKLSSLWVAATGAAVVKLDDVENIEVDDWVDDDPYVSSSTAGYQRRIPDAGDYSLSFDIFAPDGVIVWTHLKGAFIDFEAFSENAVVAKGIKGTVLITRVHRSIPIGRRGYIMIHVDCVGDGTPGLVITT